VHGEAGQNHPTHYFYRDVDDRMLGLLYGGANALIMPQKEDFGYTALEAQFFGCPVISYQEGGVKELIVEGKTGVLFERQNTACLRSAIERFDKISYNLKHETKRRAVAQTSRFFQANFCAGNQWNNYKFCTR
jgi:glycosyltransferase involved in cell wall biosynthesis